MLSDSTEIAFGGTMTSEAVGKAGRVTLALIVGGSEENVR